MNGADTVDPAAIERLCKLGGSQFAIKMIELFISYCGEKLVAARQAQVAGNLEAVALAAHPLKSSAGNVGAARVQDLAAQVEQSAKAANRELLAGQLAELEQAFAAATKLLEERKTRLAATPA